MYVLVTRQNASIPQGGAVFTYGQVLEIPPEYYNPYNMTRLGPHLTSAQAAALIPWPEPWGAPIPVE